MAHNVKLAAATANAIADAAAALCNGGTLKIYSGTQPATGDTATAETLLATCTFASPAFLTAVAGVATANAIGQDASADATGTAAWFRILDASANKVMDGSVGVGSSFDCNVVTTSVIAAAPFPIASMTLTAPES